MAVTKMLDTIAEAARTHTADERFVRTMRVSQFFAQGDLDIVRISAAEFKRQRGAAVESTQLAPGTSKGARHVAAGDIDIYRTTETDPLRGPMVHAKERWAVQHPEHADVSLPRGYFRVDYQRDYELEERQRVQD